MREALKAINNFNVKRSGCEPNLQGASLVGRDGEGRSYAAHTIGRRGRIKRRWEGRVGRCRVARKHVCGQDKGLAEVVAWGRARSQLVDRCGHSRDEHGRN